jgi:UDP-N-acetylglucosamine--N-acetylmuramyl-(pentapeptide) pyrophosphoryl-undecaprenol N-acetylglucosamine transferase
MNTDYTENPPVADTQISQMPSSKGQRLKPKVVISGIGTGGHYFPAIVVAKELLKRNVKVIFLVRRGYAEDEIAQMYNLKTFAIRSRAFYGKSLFNKIISFVNLFYSLCILKEITRRTVGIAFGGFGSLPLIISCLVNRSPFYLFEPNRIPGRATKLFSAKAKRVFLGLGLEHKIKGNLMITGIPIRQGFKTQDARARKKRAIKKKVLFLGGSQGARRLNKIAIEIQGILPKKFKILVISGRRDYDWVYKKRDDRTTVIPFTHTPWKEMSDVDLTISRSGALAGYEILSTNKPVLFIPFPYAIDDHQYFNAKYFAEIGNAIVIREEDATPQLIIKKFAELIDTRSRKGKIILDAEQRITDLVLKENA